MKSLISILIALSLTACGGGAESPQQVVQPPQLLSQVVVSKSSAKMGNVAPSEDVKIDGYRADYVVVSSNDGTVLVTNARTRVSTTYKNPKRLVFLDKVTSFDLSGPEGQVYRLYQAAFNRKPDMPGLGFWIYHNKNGMGLDSIATQFISSAEFTQMYGADVSTSKFVDLLYKNVLHRAGEPAGVAWWIAGINNGSPRHSVLNGFSESPENKNNLLEAMQPGFDYVPFGGTTIIPKFSSYENKVAASQALGPQQMPSEVTTSSTVAYADFFHDGSYSMVTHSLEYVDTWDRTKIGHIKFYKKDAEGKWVDNTQTILADNRGCLHPRKAIVSDFNGDGRPDVFFACHGYDRAPFTGESPRVLLSQSNGTYRNEKINITCFCHAATAADFKQNGFADVIVTDNMVNAKPFFLRNVNGKFVVDNISLPAKLKDKAIFSAELIDFNSDGKYDMWFGGNDPGSTVDSNNGIPPQIILNDGFDNFINTQTYDLPINVDYGMQLDMVFVGGKLYMLRTNIGGGSLNYGKSFYTTAAIQMVDLKTMKSSMVYTHSGQYANGMKWVNWLALYNNGVTAMDVTFDIKL